MANDAQQEIYLKDYTPSDYQIPQVWIDFEIHENETKVFTTLTVEPAADCKPGTPLVLDGDELKLTQLIVNGDPHLDYVETATELTINGLPDIPFTLQVETVLDPAANTKLMGLYRSSGTWCTQCEAQGFRRITYFLDRPDVMSSYTTRIEAPKELAPVLLSNGNRVALDELEDDPTRHYAIWMDPHPKPAYLFALVAGKLDVLSDSFKTMSGNDVELNIYCEPGKAPQCAYAMDSLIRSMKWDEERFGREYDLDIFNIVAVSDFNMGAMENKGLNVFNDAYILAEAKTATDTNYANIERVVAHEYFHNWTGNRITCRDWFQLCLKEGLTVFRDQEFAADMRSPAVKRIEDVISLRARQFPEDTGPLAHSVRPRSYLEINNFYTATIYVKGAEIVRMIATLLGERDFRKGMDLYFERHDGEACTIEQFLKVFEDVASRDLSHFALWYDQAGTPQVSYSEEYHADTKTYTLTLNQATAPTPGQDTKKPLEMPIIYGLVGPNGADMDVTLTSGMQARDGVLILGQESQTFVFENVSSKPVPSLFRNFSAPVTVTTELSDPDKLLLIQNDADPFNRWQNLQSLALKILIAGAIGDDISDGVDQLGDTLKIILNDDTLDDDFKCLCLNLPSEPEIARAIGYNIDPMTIHDARTRVRKTIGDKLNAKFVALYDGLADDGAFSSDGQSAGRRALRNQCLAYLATQASDEAMARCHAQFDRATNMTDQFAALAALFHYAPDKGTAQLQAFHDQFADNPLVLDKWFALQASATEDGTVDTVNALFDHASFDSDNPNRLRALLGGFAMGNPVQFARADGAGFDFVAARIVDIDQKNPQIAARLMTAFATWRAYEPKRRAKAESILQKTLETADLSKDTRDILARTLAG